MHELGYIHRDLKPDNIVLNLDPLEVRVIDFDRATIDTTATIGTAKGTLDIFLMPISGEMGVKDGMFGACQQ